MKTTLKLGMEPVEVIKSGVSHRGEKESRSVVNRNNKFDTSGLNDSKFVSSWSAYPESITSAFPPLP